MIQRLHSFETALKVVLNVKIRNAKNNGKSRHVAASIDSVKLKNVQVRRQIKYACFFSFFFSRYLLELVSLSSASVEMIGGQLGGGQNEGPPSSPAAEGGGRDSGLPTFFLCILLGNFPTLAGSGVP